MNIVTANETEVDQLEEQLARYNQTKRPYLQQEAYKTFAKVVKNAKGEVIAGGVAYASLYYIGYLDTLWVAEEHRRSGLGAALLSELEEGLRCYGCEQVHLDTFDFQGPAFYRSQGYQEFGRLTHEKVGITEYFFVKKLSQNSVKK